MNNLAGRQADLFGCTLAVRRCSMSRPSWSIKSAVPSVPETTAEKRCVRSWDISKGPDG